MIEPFPDIIGVDNDDGRLAAEEDVLNGRKVVIERGDVWRFVSGL